MHPKMYDFYNALANNDARAIRKFIQSRMFYVREAIYNRTGEWYTLTM